MLIVGVESTAHTIGIGIVEDGEVLANVNDTYVPPAGSGIHPREAAEHHAKVAVALLKRALERSRKKLDEIDAIAYSAGPGLGPALRIGAVLARALSVRLGKPLVPVHHGVAHVEIARALTGSCDPLVLLISGGHTMIVGFADGKYRVFGETLDLAIGNAIDKFARDVGLGYPGVPAVEKCAERAESVLPLPMNIIGQDLAFSGLVTRAVDLYRRGKAELPTLCKSLVETAYYMLAEVLERALAYTGKRELVVAGGVARSARLRQILEAIAADRGLSLKIVPPEYAGDNGAMIALTGYYAFRRGIKVSVEESFVKQRWRLDQVDVPWFYDICPSTSSGRTPS